MFLDSAKKEKSRRSCRESFNVIDKSVTDVSVYALSAISYIEHPNKKESLVSCGKWKTREIFEYIPSGLRK